MQADPNFSEERLKAYKNGHVLVENLTDLELLCDRNAFRENPKRLFRISRAARRAAVQRLEAESEKRRLGNVI